MEIVSIVNGYLTKLYSEIQNNKETGGAATPELSYRTHLHNFFVEISQFINENKVGIIHEPSSTGKGRPDFRFHDKTTFGVYGYIEVKPFEDKEINIDEYSQQIDKYIQLGSNVILTDGLEFLLFNEKQEEYQKVNLVKSKKRYLEDGITKENIGDLEAFFHLFSSFLSHIQPRVVNQKTLINLLAKRANLIRFDVETLITRPQKGTPNEKVSNNLELIFGIFKEQLDENLDEETFSSLVGQILIFSLLVAYSELIEEQSEINDSSLREYFLKHDMQSYRPLRALISILKDVENEMGLIKAGWSDAALLLSYIQIEKEQLGNYHDLYEMFHYSYNPEEKMDFGAYATPIYLANYAVTLSQEVIKNKLGSNMFNENVKIVDPSCGTGTFLEAIINLSKASNEKIHSQISGVEILPVPYTLAQMRLNQFQAKLDDEERKPRVLLGNSLSNSIVTNDLLLKTVDDDIESVKLLKEEYNELQYATNKPIVAIVGNPPSSDKNFNVGENFTEIESALEEFRPPISERGARQNIQKSLQNDFVKFIVWACLKVDEVGGGVISFIVPNSALRDRSYVYMRNYLLNNYQEIYVLEFDEDLRKNQKQSSRNIFKTMQGRTLITLVKKPIGLLEPQPASASVFYKSIKNENDKRKWLQERKENLLSDYQEIQPYGWLKAFIPVTVENDKVKTYERYISLEEVFANHISGVKTGCTALVTHPEKETLIRKLKDYTIEKISDEEIYEKYFKGQKVNPYKEGRFGKGWKRAFVAREIEKTFKDGLIFNYDFRPFLKGYVFYSKSVMKEASKDGGRARPELEKIFVDNDYSSDYALALAKNPSQIGNDLDQFVSIVNNLPDNDLSSRGNAYIFPIVFPEQRTSELKGNINDKIIKIVKELYDSETDEKKIANDLVLYIYAILSSNTYREHYYEIIYHGLLKGMVRVPLPVEKDLYFKLRDLGNELAKAQLSKVNINLSESTIECEGDINIPVQKIIYSIDEKTILFKGYHKQESFTLKNVPSEVYGYSIMGYDVLDTYLKYKKYPYINRGLSDVDIKEIIKMIESLVKYMKTIEGIDSVVEEILATS